LSQICKFANPVQLRRQYAAGRDSKTRRHRRKRAALSRLTAFPRAKRAPASRPICHQEDGKCHSEFCLALMICYLFTNVG
jgi:hypothetical protein